MPALDSIALRHHLHLQILFLKVPGCEAADVKSLSGSLEIIFLPQSTIRTEDFPPDHFAIDRAQRDKTSDAKEQVCRDQACKNVG